MKQINHSKVQLDSQAISAVGRVLKTGHIAQGLEVACFEKELARYLNRGQGVALSSGTAALHLALLSLGVGAKHEVILPSYVCCALLLAVRYVGAKPVFIDINPDDLSFNVAEIRQKATRKTKALILPHPFGYPLNMAPYLKLGIPIIEDIATSIGAQYGKKKVGEEGKITVVSFYATKMITTGEGGMLLCDSAKLASQVRSWRSYDQKQNCDLAFNYKMTDFQAALGRVQLKKLPLFVKQRQKIASFYFAKLKEKVTFPLVRREAQPAYHRFLFSHPQGEQLIKRLNAQGIAARKPVFKPLHHYFKLKGFKGTERLFREQVSLPIYPSLSLTEAKTVSTQLENSLGGIACHG